MVKLLKTGGFIEKLHQETLEESLGEFLDIPTK